MSAGPMPSGHSPTPAFLARGPRGFPHLGLNSPASLPPTRDPGPEDQSPDPCAGERISAARAGAGRWVNTRARGRGGAGVGPGRPSACGMRRPCSRRQLGGRLPSAGTRAELLGSATSQRPPSPPQTQCRENGRLEGSKLGTRDTTCKKQRLYQRIPPICPVSYSLMHGGRPSVSFSTPRGHFYPHGHPSRA